MSRGAKKRIKIPPFDSWLGIEPGSAKVRLDPPFLIEWDSKKKDFRHYRGAVIAASFDMEMAIDSLLLNMFYPGERECGSIATAIGIPLKDARNEFEASFLKKLTLVRKIKILSDTVLESRQLSAIVSRGFKSDLNRAANIRNRFAHYPVTFFPKGTTEGELLEARLMCSDREVILDQKFGIDYRTTIRPSSAGSQTA